MDFVPDLAVQSPFLFFNGGLNSFFPIKMIKTLSKVDKTIDDINEKSAKLDGVFNLVDKSADVLNTVSDTAVNYITGLFLKLVNRKKNKEGEDINE